jgi:multicomponent Na+:H+ antiporter subunit D
VEARAPVLLALAGLVAGFLVKAGLFPLHVWLPDAHAIAPSPINAVLLGAGGQARHHRPAAGLPAVRGGRLVPLAILYEALAWLGAISIIAGAFFALFQEDIKLMLAYSTISNIGYIVLGLGVASELAVTGATVHVLNHALIKATLFLAAGAMIHQSGYRSLTDLRGIGRVMPWTSLALLSARWRSSACRRRRASSASGTSRWARCRPAGRCSPVVVLAGALLVFIYFLRMLNAFYFRAPTHEEMLAVREAPASMLVPVLAAGRAVRAGGPVRAAGRWR